MSLGEGAVIPSIVILLLEQIEFLGFSGTTYESTATCIELYDETRFDLLHQGNRTKVDNGMPTTRLPAQSRDNFHRILSLATANRSTGRNLLNETSSRSHMVLTLLLEGRSAEGKLFQGVLSLIDLAGSEKSHQSNARGRQLAEPNSINLGLPTLNRVFAAIVNKNAYIPY
jgi:hypothetical protein